MKKSPAFCDIVISIMWCDVSVIESHRSFSITPWTLFLVNGQPEEISREVMLKDLSLFVTLYELCFCDFCLKCYCVFLFCS